MKRHLTIALALLCLSGFAQEKQVNKTFSGITKIRLSTASGDCYLKKGTGNDVKVDMKYTYSEDEYTPVLEKEGSTLVLREEFEGNNHHGNSTWTLTIPDGLQINFNTGSGNIEAQSLSFDGKINLGSGDVDLKTVKGEVRINAGSGDIILEGVNGEFEGNTGSGNVSLAKSEGDFGFNAGSGKIRMTDVKGVLSANVGSGRITADQITLKGSGSFNSGSGNVAVTLSSPLDYDISVNSGSGDAVLNFNGNKIDGTVVMTANKRNGDIVAPFNFDKTEELDDDGRNVRIRKTAKLGSKDIKINVSTGSGTAKIEK